MKYIAKCRGCSADQKFDDRVTRDRYRERHQRATGHEMVVLVKEEA